MASVQARGRVWGITIKGNVYTLDTGAKQWQYVHNHGQVLRGFKRVSSTNQGAWGLGCDHQVYVFVNSSDVPIRCQLTTYENERWVPARGWSCDHLIPSVDPWQWSSEDGNVHLPKAVFKLPSHNWQWESDWGVDENVQGFLTDKGGWRYSNVDFHGKFSHQKSFRSCVRRRKWIRHYRYTSTGVWARIPSIHVDPLEEPIVDLAASGQEIPNQLQGFVAVWAVTIDGRVLFRTGISSLCPEGQAWVDVPIEDGDEVLSIGVGPTDLVWAATWTGHLLVRTGINWQNPRGTGWSRLNAPMSEDKLVQVAVGNKAVWATTVTGHVWFRKGVKDSSDKNCVENMKGTGWLRMVNKMKTIAIGPEDRVWGIDYDSRQVYFRQGISAEEPSGRTWICTTMPLMVRLGISTDNRVQSQLSVVSSASSGSSATDFITTSNHRNDVTEINGVDSHNHMLCGTIPGQWQDQRDIKLTDLDADDLHHFQDSTISSGKVPKSKSVPANIANTESQLPGAVSGKDTQGKRRNAPQQLVYNIHSRAKARSKKMVKFLRDRINRDLLTDGLSEEGEEGLSVHFSTTTSSLELNYQNESEATDDSITDDSIQESVSHDHIKTAGSVGERPVSDDLSSTDLGRDELDTQPDTEDTVLWLWLSANCCHIHDEAHIKHWFSIQSAPERSSRISLEYQRQMSHSPWRSRILTMLSDRRERDQTPYAHYNIAVERSCWRKCAQLKWYRDTERKSKWVSADVELVQDSDTTEKDGTFTIQYKVKKQPKHLTFSLKDIASVVIATEAGIGPVLALHLISRIHMSPRQPPIKLAATAEQDMEDWVGALSVACCDHRGTGGAAHPHSIWAVTDRGDILVHEPDPYLFTESATDMFWHQYGGHMRQVESCPAGVTWGVGHDGRLHVYTGGYGGAFFKGMASSPHGINNQSDTRELHVYENQRWRPISGYTDRMLFTDSHSWSDKTGKLQCTKDGTKLPSKHWTWSTEWMIDRKVEGGVDKDGWQYGRKINRPFYSQPRINSVIRRRHWIRKCSVMTSGPWLEVGPHTLRDVSLQLDSHSSERLLSELAVWAVATNGEVLYRTGVSRNNPQGTSWVHVPADLAYRSISVGGNYRVWATALDGSVWLRHGADADNPIGDCWLHIAPPAGTQLTQISAGSGVVWVIDKNRRLWCRKGITTTHTEGTEWVQVACNIRTVSCGPNNQVWVCLDQVLSSDGRTDGVLARRVGLLRDITKHGSWDYGLGGGLSYISVRGWMK